MRIHCLDCARKHVGQASVLIDEAVLGYPAHAWLAVGHLAEAESELLSKGCEYLDAANRIRQFRLAYMNYINAVDIGENEDSFELVGELLEIIAVLTSLNSAEALSKSHEQ